MKKGTKKATRKAPRKSARELAMERGRVSKKTSRKRAAKPAAGEPRATVNGKEPKPVKGTGTGKGMSKRTVTLRAGTVLKRTYHGKVHEVRATATGFVYDGTEYRSLSRIASVITGWDAVRGPKFFGLRD